MHEGALCEHWYSDNASWFPQTEPHSANIIWTRFFEWSLDSSFASELSSNASTPNKYVPTTYSRLQICTNKYQQLFTDSRSRSKFSIVSMGTVWCDIKTVWFASIVYAFDQCSPKQMYNIFQHKVNRGPSTNDAEAHAPNQFHLRYTIHWEQKNSKCYGGKTTDDLLPPLTLASFWGLAIFDFGFFDLEAFVLEVFGLAVWRWREGVGPSKNM